MLIDKIYKVFWSLYSNQITLIKDKKYPQKLKTCDHFLKKNTVDEKLILSFVCTQCENFNKSSAFN